MTTSHARPAAADPPAPTAKEHGERLRRLRWMAGEVARIRDEQRASRATLSALIETESRRALQPEERARRRDLGLRLRSSQLRLQELHAEFETLRSGRTSYS